MWAYRATFVALLAGATLISTACRTSPPAAAPVSPTSSVVSPSATATPTPTPTAQPSVFGTLNVRIAKTTKDAVLPRAPVTYTLVIKTVNGGAESLHPVGSDGLFALALAPGTYDLQYLEIQAADLGPEPFRMPLTATDKVRFTAPASGCVYGGRIDLLYGRLPAGTQEQQAFVIGQIQNSTGGGQVMFAYLPSGGFLITGGQIGVPPVANRPAAVRGCVVKEFSSLSSGS